MPFANSWKFQSLNSFEAVSGTIIIKIINMEKHTKQQAKEILKQEHVENDTKAAEKAAEADIERDLDLTPPSDPGDDLDEGELARLEGEGE